MVLSTKEHHEIMKNLSVKCSSSYSLLPSITSIPSEINPGEPSSNEATSSVSTLITEINSSKKIKGELLELHQHLFYCSSFFFTAIKLSG